MKGKTALLIGGVLVLLIAEGALAYNLGANAGREEVRNTRLEFTATRFNAQGAQPAGADAATSQSTTPAAQGQRGQQGQAGQQGQFPQGARGGVIGTVKSVTGNTFDVAMQNGNIVTVTIDAQTQIQKTLSGTAADIAPGVAVTVVTDQTGASVTARVIQLRPGGQ